MIKAGSLFYAVVISIIIAIVSSSFILFTYLCRIESDQLSITERLNRNADSGLNLLMAEQSLVELNESKTIDLYGFDEDSVFLSRKPWGAFEVLISSAGFRGQKVERIAQAGWAKDSTQQFSIYLADEGKPLALCGKTVIRGNAFLPKLQVERVYIEGQSFIGTKLINGTIYKSKNNLPVCNPSLIGSIQALLKEKRINETDSLIELQQQLSGDSIANSFRNKTLILHSAGIIKIYNSTISGNVIICSDTLITISPTAVLNNNILIAPHIVFEKDFKGHVQAFASDSIRVADDVSLYYPSVLGIVNPKASNACAIVLSKSDTITGSVFAYQPRIDNYKRAGIRIKEKSVVVGQVYSTGYAELQGSIYGSLMCSSLLLETPSSVYENHLLNAVIDQTALPDYYTGAGLIKESSFKKIVKWLE